MQPSSEFCYIYRFVEYLSTYLFKASLPGIRKELDIII